MSAVVMKPSTVYQFVLLVCILEKKIKCVSSCGSGQYYSDDIPGCVGCPANCDDQYDRDKERCKEACEKKITSTPRQVKTKVPKSDTSKSQFTSTPSLFKIPSTTKEKHLTETTVAEKFITPNNTTQPFKKTGLSANYELSGKASSTVNSVDLGLAVGLGVSGAFMVCLVLLVVYMWRCSRTSRESQIESCIEPSTSSQEPSPVTKRSHSEQAISVETEIDGIPLPLQETETENLIPSVINMSSLHLKENEN